MNCDADAAPVWAKTQAEYLKMETRALAMDTEISATGVRVNRK
jgi:hypothetical protein